MTVIGKDKNMNVRMVNFLDMANDHSLMSSVVNDFIDNLGVFSIDF
jgi:hypothetical protein